MSPTEKSKIVNAASLAVIHGLLPFRFTDKKRGMSVFMKSIFEAGQSCPVGANIDIDDMMPCAKSVKEGVRNIAKKQRLKFRDSDIAKVQNFGGGVSCDGLKQKSTGTKFYDFVVHYIKVGKPSMLTGRRPAWMVSRILLLKEHIFAETAINIRELLRSGLQNEYGVEFDQFMSRFTFVTDCASTMPCIVGASSSSSRVPFTEKWLGCISHQLNTVMKNVMADDERKAGVVSTNLSSLKTIVRIFKQGNWNKDLPPGYALIQEIETRFGTTHDVAARFIKSADKVSRIVSEKDSEPAKLALSALETSKGSNHSTNYPAIVALTVAFRPIREMQTALEASESPTMHLILPRLEHLKTVMAAMSGGMGQAPAESAPNHVANAFCQSTLAYLNRVEVHDLWVAGAILHPKLRSLSCIPDLPVREALRGRGCTLIRRMMNSTNTRDQEIGQIVQGNAQAGDQGSSVSGCSIQEFSLDRILDAPETMANNFTDELDKYLNFAVDQRAASDLMADNLGIARFWANHQRSFPCLSETALRIFATPVSSTASERNFSAVNRIVTHDRTRLSSTIIEDLVTARSFLNSEYSSDEDAIDD